MEDNELFSAAINHSSFDEEGLDVLPLITKERTQRFELLLHLIPNLKQHIILLGASGIGKTLLLDMLYDIDSEAWQCCFVQGSADLSFETVEAQLSKTMLRNKHASLDSALQKFREQHKKIVLIIDDAGLLVSGLMTTLIEYAASQSAIKLIFSLTPEARNNHRKTDKALDDCYLLELP
ncbi:MAG: ATP-binding protein, partial [Methylococcales bacterium]|nr:ATP-binding protein [Methylococcales bacterium]